MKKQSDFNTKKITNAANSFEKDFFKLMFNSVFGKTMEKLQKTINVRLVNNKKVVLKYTSRPSHITHKNFGKNYAAIHEIKPVLTLNKPIYVEFAVLELRKWLMYDFYYNFIITYFDSEPLFTDTNSITYEQFFKHKHLFDFSNYPKDSKFLDETNKKVIGKMKDESEGKVIDEFVGLKSTEFNEFKDTLFNKKVLGHKMRRIQGKKT